MIGGRNYTVLKTDKNDNNKNRKNKQTLHCNL